MYQPPHHREDRLDVQHALIRAHPLGTLVTMGASGLVANALAVHARFRRAALRDAAARTWRAPITQWRDFDPAVEALVIFQGVETLHHAVVVRDEAGDGKSRPDLELRDRAGVAGRCGSSKTADWLATSDRRADGAAGSPAGASPGRSSDAPPSFVESQLKGIVGIEIPIARIEGKWKVSQNRPEADRQGVVEGLRDAGDAASVAMAELVRERGR